MATYLAAIVAANLLVAEFGPSAAIWVAFLFIGFDLTVRDGLHEKWKGRKLWWKMLLLVGSGSCLSYLINRESAAVALASFVAFLAAGMVDTAIYILLGDRAKFTRINGSNVAAALVDSILFPSIAFGLFIPWVILGQFLAKTLGGLVWAVVLYRKQILVWAVQNFLW